ncbi:P-loop containing nucleoside triphosphate hydrolase protein [Absidia repens]|uniref:Structural maintenance of chromosomes protein 5 n=1 Tax=Absidia repens TaxID=90262 RepID=A0A1X2IAJ7_9FUNG|nr:P-loop containing nucleoside triphosphate hydrolase protein [Absidia repens]
MPLRRKLDDYNEEGHSESSQMAMKRKRMTIDDDSSDDDIDNGQSNTNGDDDEDDTDNVNLPTASLVFDHPVAPLPVGEDGYVEGSIVKMVLRNFVTYDYCEFTPGPQLNMIIGPNGTGKSTIVCAVALGLGGSPLLLGRARNISDFVKTGEEEASIQIELKKVDGQNVVIQRKINKSNNSSGWKLNGRTSTSRDVLSVIASLNIQVDNLCQFLPQDKVAEFAQLTPPLLLSRTQVAVGDKDLVKWHEQLINKRQKQKELQKSHESNLNHHKDLQSRNQLLEKDIHRIKEREKLGKEIALLQAKLPLAMYADAKKDYEESKTREKEALDEKIRLDHEAGPVVEALRNCEVEKERDANEKNKAATDARTLSSELQKTTELIRKSTHSAAMKKADIEGIKKRELKREDEIRRMETMIRQLEENVREEPPTANDELNEEIAAITREINDISIESKTDIDSAQDFVRQKNEKDRQISNKKSELNELKDIRRIRLENLKRHQIDTYKAFSWYKENSTLFKGKIHGPIQLAVNLKDKRYADQVESALGGVSSSHLRTFVCENAEDYKMFMAELVDKQGLRLTASWPGDIDIASTVRTPCSDEELKSNFGLDHFVINLLEGPAIVLAYLCQQLYINTFPIGLQNVNIERIVERSSFLRFAVGGNMYRVKKYSYGRGGFQTTVRPTGSAKILTDTMDKELFDKKHNELKQLQVMSNTIESEIQLLNTRKQEYKQKLHELKHKRDDKKSLRQDIIDTHNRWEGQKRRIRRLQEDLETKKAEPAGMEQEIANLKEEIVIEAKRRGKLVLQYKQIVESYVNKVMQRNKLSLQSLSSWGRLESMNTFAKSQQLHVKEATQLYNQARTHTQNCKAIARRHFESANKAGQELSEDLQGEFKKICDDWKINGLDKTHLEIEDEIQGLQAKSDALKMINPLAATTYEKLMTEMKNLDAKIASNSEELETISKDITELHSSWEPRLERLVARISEKFSEAFERIGCAGEVGIGRDEDYAKWGINIQVKFRDNEKLQLLTGQRQSGGERAVSTILYLMSLQNLARAPFRVVDEINQGMDPRNERMIHEQIVKSASLAGTSQYFLITPKLLPDLYYNEHMRVLCIYNGEWQPEKLKSADHYLRQAKEAMAAV